MAAALLVVFVLGWWLARRRFVGQAAAMVRLESRLGLNNRLSAAAAGACGLAAGAGAGGPRHSLGRGTVGAAVSGGRTVVGGGLVGAGVTAGGRRALDELEATDKMRETHLQGVAQSQRNLSRTGQGISRLAGREGVLGAKTRAGLQDQFKQAVESMQQVAMSPKPETMRQLKDINPTQLEKIDPEELERLVEELRKAAEEIGECCGPIDGDAGEGVDGDGEDGEESLDPKEQEALKRFFE